MRTAALLLLCLIMTLSCAPREMAILSLTTGQTLEANGSMRDPSLVYVFKKYDKRATNRKLFQFLYFEGDTLCFSLKLSTALTDETVSVDFINPVNGQRFPAERIDRRGDTVGGFSLVGSIMESFYLDSLEKPAPKNNFCCEDIPFEVEAVIRGATRTVTKKAAASFRITYR